MPNDAGLMAWSSLVATLEATWPIPDGLSIREEREVRRRIADTLAAATAAPIDDGARIHEIRLALGGRTGFARVYEPWGTTAPAPTQVFLHGGGFVYGGARELVNDSMLAARSVATGIRIVSLEYPLAPEHPFPEARDVTIAALGELIERADELGVDVTRLGLGGNSAGASIAASATLQIARAGGPTLHHLCLEVPAVSLHGLEQYGGEDAEVLRDAVDRYRPARDGSAFVADADDLDGFPPTLIMLAEHDPVSPGGALLAARLVSAGTPVSVHTVPDTVHASPGLTRVSTQAAQWSGIVDAALRTAYGTTAATAGSDDAR